MFTDLPTDLIGLILSWCSYPDKIRYSMTSSESKETVSTYLAIAKQDRGSMFQVFADKIKNNIEQGARVLNDCMYISPTRRQMYVSGLPPGIFFSSKAVRRVRNGRTRLWTGSEHQLYVIAHSSEDAVRIVDTRVHFPEQASPMITSHTLTKADFRDNYGHLLYLRLY